MNYIYPAIQANAIYEDRYLMGTSLARPCIAKGAIDAAKATGCTAVSHGATGKGNDQVRFELSFYALAPQSAVIAPWRDPSFLEAFDGRDDMLEYADKHGIPVSNYGQAKPYSMDDNMMHISYESGILEDPMMRPTDDMWRMTTSPQDAPDQTERISIDFKAGLPTKVTNLDDDTVKTDAVECFLYLNALGGKHGVGRIDIVENRFVGIKSRGCYETPAGAILRSAHIDLEAICMDREVRRLRDMMSAKFTESVYNGFWFAPEMEFMLNGIRKSQENVEGTVTLELYKGNVTNVGRSSPYSLYDKDLTSMDFSGNFDPTDSSGFVKINSIRLKANSALMKKKGKTFDDATFNQL